MAIETLARRAGIHPTYLSRIELARNNPTWEKLCALATALDVPASTIALAAEQELRRRTDGSDSGESGA